MVDMQKQILNLMQQEQRDRKEQIRQGQKLIDAMNGIFKKGN